MKGLDAVTAELVALGGQVKWKESNGCVFQPGGVCEGVGKRSFLTLKATMPCGKKDRFPGGDGYEKR